MKDRKQFDSITGLRALACLCIVCYHYFCLYVDDPGLGRDLLPWYPHSAFFFEYSKNAVEMPGTPAAGWTACPSASMPGGRSGS